MSADRKKPGWAFWATAAIIVVPVLYVLSFGPACWIASRTTESYMPAAYRPFEHTILGEGLLSNLVRWYVGIGMPQKGQIKLPTSTNREMFGFCIYNDEMRTGIVGVYTPPGSPFYGAHDLRRGFFGPRHQDAVHSPVPNPGDGSESH